MLSRPKSLLDLEKLDPHYDARASLDMNNKIGWDMNRQENFSVFAKPSPPKMQNSNSN